MPPPKDEATPLPAAQGSIETFHSGLGRAFTLLYLLAGLSYLWWRTAESINWHAPYLSLPLLAADYLGFGFFLLFAVNLWTRIRRHPPSPEAGLSVDVFITTYNEPVSVLRPTVASAVAMDYPHTTYVLDDGRRESVRELAAELGAVWLTRSDNRHAKAGNVNAALARTRGEFIATFDADHAPFKHFLTELLGYFRDPAVALVQAPQAYYNLDSFQHIAKRRSRHEVPWHEQSVFFDAIMPGKDRWNASFWCGSTAIIRRTALVEVGGVNTTTVTEDMHTAMCLHARGWKSVYHDRELALGIAPDDLAAFLVQRQRWAQGAMQILRSDNPLIKRGLTFRQRLAYFTSVVYVIEYMPKLIYLVTPAAALYAGQQPMVNMGWNLVFRFLPYFVCGIVATSLLTGGTNPYLAAERFHILKLWIMLRALTTVVVPRKLKFNVTPKTGSLVTDRFVNLRLLVIQVAVVGLSLVAAIWALIGAAVGAPWKLTGLPLTLTLGWALFNAGFVAQGVRSVLRRHHRRVVYRFPIDIPVAITVGGQTAIVRAVDVSDVGLGWLAPHPAMPGEAVAIRLRTGNGEPIASTVRVRVCVREGDLYRVGGEFEGLSPEAERALVLFLFQQVAPESLRMGPVPGEAGHRPSPLAALNRDRRAAS